MIAELAPGASETLEKAGTSIKGNYTNGASADPAECPAATDRSWYTGITPGITINKVTVDGATSGDGLNILTGEPIKWRYEVNATGGTLTGVTVTDSKGVAVTRMSATRTTTTSSRPRRPGSTRRPVRPSPARTQHGHRIRHVHGPRRPLQDVTKSDASNYFGANPQISIDKKTNGEDDGGFIHVGETVTWTYTVTNVGNVPLSNVSVTDDKIGAVGTIASLGVGESTTFTKAAAAEAGAYTNIGTATGTYTDSAGHTRADTESDSSKYFGSAPAVELTKTGKWVDGNDNGFADVGEVINYTFAVKNTGNVVLYDLKLADLVGGVTVTGGPLETLAVGATDTSTFTGSYIITSADLDAEKFVNTAEVKGHGPAADAVSDTDDETVMLPAKPVLSVKKSADPTFIEEPGADVTYTYLITNDEPSLRQGEAHQCRGRQARRPADEGRRGVD